MGVVIESHVVQAKAVVVEGYSKKIVDRSMGIVVNDEQKEKGQWRGWTMVESKELYRKALHLSRQPYTNEAFAPPGYLNH